MSTSFFFYKKIDDFSEKYAHLTNKTRYWGYLITASAVNVLPNPTLSARIQPLCTSNLPE